ncbi:MAG TPA: amidohydrolase, partial [Acidobacteriota bacterium]|nr:amidohydrolase [Acidobacteriota bacterium]
YFKTVQTSETTYTPFIGPSDRAATHLNEEIMKTYREALKPFYYDSSRFDTYLEQLGIQYPTIKPPDDRGGN